MDKEKITILHSKSCLTGAMEPKLSFALSSHFSLTAIFFFFFFFFFFRFTTGG